MMHLGRILVIEDHADLAGPVCQGLSEEGYFVRHTLTGVEGMRLLNDSWDLVILDLTLPDIPGESILSNLKQKPDYPPVLILTARSQIQDKIDLFRQGCDDYMTKPFIFDELLGRVRALLRRSHRVLQDSTQLKELQLDPTTHILKYKTKSVQLTPKESSLIQFLMGAQERVVSRKELLHHGWGLKEEPETNFIGVHLFNLRKKLSEIECDDWLITLRGSGFTFKKPEKRK